MPRVDVCKRINAERNGMGCHVQAIREKRHGAEDDARDDLDHHHQPGDGDYNQSAGLSRLLLVLAE